MCFSDDNIRVLGDTALGSLVPLWRVLWLACRSCAEDPCGVVSSVECVDPWARLCSGVMVAPQVLYEDWMKEAIQDEDVVFRVRCGFAL